MMKALKELPDFTNLGMAMWFTDESAACVRVLLAAGASTRRHTSVPRHIRRHRVRAASEKRTGGVVVHDSESGTMNVKQSNIHVG